MYMYSGESGTLLLLGSLFSRAKNYLDKIMSDRQTGSYIQQVISRIKKMNNC